MLIFGLMLIILMSGAPIAFALLIAAIVGLYLMGGMAVVQGFLDTTPMSATSYELVTIPMFLIMAELLIVSGITNALFKAIAMWVGRLPGGLAIATAFAGAGFGALCGSSAASAATLSSATIPSMIEQKYDTKLATGVVAISGTLAMLIPPSIALIIYGFIAGVSIGKLLIAGIIPGLIVAGVIVTTILILIAFNPQAAPRGKQYSLREKLWALRKVGPAAVLILVVTGSIYLGIATPTEASALGALGALFLAIASRTGAREILHAFVKGTRTTAMILLIILAGHLFGYFFTITRTTGVIVDGVLGFGLPPLGIMSAIILVLILLGCFIDGVTIIILTVPLLLPIVEALGYDPIWFGIILVVAAEIGVVTPPLGINVFVVSKSANRPVEDVFRGVTPHIFAHIFILFSFLLLPGIITWVPNTMAR